MTSPDYPRALKGIRCRAWVTLRAGSAVLAESQGEIQFTETGVSGPAAFDVSRDASVGGSGLDLHLCFFDLSERELVGELARRQAFLPQLPVSEIFTGMLHNRLGRMVVRYSGLTADRTLSALSEHQLAVLARAALDFILPVHGTEDFDHAQVTAGGVMTAHFDPETLESRIVPGLFVCGELLDVDGDCGGYNLQWAWSSGRLAGRLGS